MIICLTPKRRIVATLLLVAVLMFLVECTKSSFIPEGYVIVCARDFAVAEYTREYPTGRIIYELDKAGDYIITSVAYEPRRKIVVVAITSKEPKKGTASIRLLDVKTCSILKEIATNKDYIRGMSIDREGRIVFAANDMYRERPGELCYLSINTGIVHTVAKGRHFNSPCWDKNSKKIYFSYIKDSDKGIAYVELSKPGAINKIAEGLSVSASESGKVVYLTHVGEIILMQKSQGLAVSKQELKRVDPKFTDSIRIVKGTEDIVLQHYKKSIVYDLSVLQSPYTKEKVMLSNSGMKDYDVASEGR
jgi:predicted nucleic acid-binding protein